VHTEYHRDLDDGWKAWLACNGTEDLRIGVRSGQLARNGDVLLFPSESTTRQALRALHRDAGDTQVQAAAAAAAADALNNR